MGSGRNPLTSQFFRGTLAFKPAFTRRPQVAGVRMLPRAKSRSEADDNELFNLRARSPQIIPVNREALPPDSDLDEPDYGIFSGDNGDISPHRELRDADLTLPRSIRKNSMFVPVRQPYQTWAIVLGSLVILAGACLIWMIGYRIGLFRSTDGNARQNAPLVSGNPPLPSSEAQGGAVQSHAISRSGSTPPAKSPRLVNATPPSTRDELIIYEKGKVIFRMKPMPSEGPVPAMPRSTLRDDPSSIGDRTRDGIGVRTPSSESLKVAAPVVWFAPSEAERQLIERIEPEYPVDALAAHRAGDVSLEVQVAEDGTVFSVHTLAGDPLLAAAAAQAVRKWRYQPYRQGGHPTSFQTDVTLTFSLPN
jgi:TonB family protein